MHLSLKLTNLIANNCIKLLLLTSEQNLCEMAQVRNAARNGAVCYHHDSKEIFVLLCLFLPQGPTLYCPVLVSGRHIGKNIGHHLVARQRLDNTFWTDGTLYNKPLPFWKITNLVILKCLFYGYILILLKSSTENICRRNVKLFIDLSSEACSLS